jgi:uncharacterized phage-associated protein
MEGIMTMRFPFREKKSAQAAAHLLARHGGSLNYMVLIKLLYLSDRRALVESGMPITGDQPFSMPHGPVLSKILDLINMGREDHASVWFEYVSEPRDYDVALVIPNPDTSELSEYELRVLDSVDEQFGRLDKWRLRDLTHKLPEWVDPKGSSIPIQFKTILEASDKTKEDIERISADARELEFLESLGA